MTGFALPRNLVDSVRADRSPDRDAWLARLPGLVQAFAEQWALQIGPPYQPGGRCAWAAPARDRAGREVVLKVAWQHDEALHETQGLYAWDGAGMVGLHRHATAEQSSILLLERCRPGTALGQVLPEPEQDLVVAGLLTRLWQAPLSPAGAAVFRPLQVMCDAWAAEFEQRLAGTREPHDPGLTRACLELLRLLPSTADRQVLLCTDLHAGNILAAEREPWLAIDPKPYVGDPTYDAVQHLLNCEQRLHADPAGLAHRMAGLLDLDAGRLVRWLFARCVQESLDAPELGRLAIRLAAAI
ncbi:aminoglycoside phosphotransferase family protein [Actinoplanes sp. NBC_00393]|uniref:aminoglycoside phosphotransferase family protein n=1 Tax=Actinoplanes sp. NBC_00393 TaxID=2975953 RepID=UPI002E1CB268